MAKFQDEIPSSSSLNEENDDITPSDPQTTLEDPENEPIEDIIKVGFRSLIEATRCSNSFPTDHEWDLYTSYPSFGRVMKEEGNKLLEVIHTILQHQGIPGNILRRPIDEKLDLINDANDSILERVGMHLDELDGIRRKPEPMFVEVAGDTTKVISGSWNKQPSAAVYTDNPSRVCLLTAKNIERPQVKFKDSVDNSNNPFEPRIKDKPNSLKPLAILVEENELGEECFSHPYHYELDHFKPTPSHLAKVEVTKYKPLEETPLVLISTPDQLPDLVNDLEKYTEISVDLEHHSYRTFLGITCLMQISTRDTDYIIDTLTVRDSIHCLNQVFTKPSIVKVLHGASSDVEWLQRDLGLYVVNMFDTYHAARLLNIPKLSLAFLLSKYCNINVNKRFQLADWRIRPLPQQLLDYARGDTHYLLYVHDLMRNELIDAGLGHDNLLASVYQRGVDLCKKRYVKPIWREDSHMQLYQKSGKMFDNRQLYAFSQIYNWRDKTARQEDESTGYVLPTHMLLHMCETMPREMQGILACCNPIPPLVRQNLVLLHQIVLKAREQPLIKLIEENRPSTQRQTWSAKVNAESTLHCPHDLTKMAEFRDDLPTLIGRADDGDNGNERKRKKTSSVLVCRKQEPEVTVFENELMFSTTLPETITEILKQVKFVSPYERCKLVQPYMQEEEAAKAKLEEMVETDQERVDRIKEHFIQESKRLEQPDRQGHNEKTLRSLKQYSRPKRQPDATEEVEVKEDEEEVPVQVKQSSESNKRKRDAIEEVQVKEKKEEVPVQVEQSSEQVQPKLEMEMPVVLNKTRKRKAKKERPHPSETPFTPFDYKNVDFSKFKGGSELTSEQKRAFKSRDKNTNKNKKKSFGSNNKSYTFGK